MSAMEDPIGNTPRSGFTLVELLVSLAIIGLLIGITLPAVQMARESARRTHCLNNLRQVGLALLHYEGANSKLPPGIRAFDAEEFASSTWLAQILPYVEQHNLWDQMVADYEFDSSPFISHFGIRTPVNIYACPSDPVAGRIHSTHQSRIVASTNYLGLNGTNFMEKDGVFYLESETTLASITDGQSNTLMVGERPPSPDFWYGWWYAGFGREGSGAPDMLLGVSELNMPSSSGVKTYLEDCDAGPYTFMRGKNRQCDVLHFWSHHPGGANFVLCDGSTRFIAYADSLVMDQLATRREGEVVQAPW